MTFFIDSNGGGRAWGEVPLLINLGNDLLQNNYNECGLLLYKQIKIVINLLTLITITFENGVKENCKICG